MNEQDHSPASNGKNGISPQRIPVENAGNDLARPAIERVGAGDAASRATSNQAKTVRETSAESIVDKHDKPASTEPKPAAFRQIWPEEWLAEPATETPAAAAGGKRGRKAMLITLIVVFAMVLVGGGYIYSKLNLIRYMRNDDYTQQSLPVDEDGVINIDPEETMPPEATELDPESLSKLNQQLDNSNNGLLYDENILNILLIGVDSREQDNFSRSDSMILLSIDSKNEKIYMNSLMRDLYVRIPGFGYGKLNAANAIGGPPLLMQTLRENFAVSVEHFALVNLHNMFAIIDAIDGVMVDVSQAELSEVNYHLRFFNWETGVENLEDGYLTEPGYQRLNGKQAATYARIRSVGNADYDRTERQREVLSAIVDQVKKAKFSQLNEVMDVVLPEIMTNFTRRDILTLLASAPAMLDYEITTGRVPIDYSFEETYIGGMAVLAPNLKDNIGQCQ